MGVGGQWGTRGRNGEKDTFLKVHFFIFITLTCAFGSTKILNNIEELIKKSNSASASSNALPAIPPGFYPQNN